jgi:hypothetical protein
MPPHVFEHAPSGRAKCRACRQAIALGDLRFGERMPNPYRDGEMTLWFHPLCAAYRRPEPLLATLEQAPGDPDACAQLERAARQTLAHRRLPRIDGAERAPSGKAKCRACRESIPSGSWRIRLVYFEEGRFTPGGTVHLACAPAYFEGQPFREPLLCFSQELPEAERAELLALLAPAR